MRYTPAPQSLFIKNRLKFREQMAPGSIAVFFSNYRVTVNADMHYRFEQDSNFYYLAGLDQEDCILFLFPEAPQPKDREVLFIKPTNEHIQVWEGWKYSVEEAREASGVETIKYLNSFESFMADALGRSQAVYLDFNEHSRNSHYTVSRAHDYARELRKKFPGHQFRRAYPILAKLRMKKEPEEIEVMRQACKITEIAFRKVLEVTQPGKWEYEIEGEIRKQFVANRGTKPAYEPIVATGANACVLHYNLSHSQLNAGELMLMDFGTEYANYSSDLSRTIPVNGRFTDRQRAVYEAVLRVQQNAIARLRPGTDFQEYKKAADQDMEQELLQLGLIAQKDIDEAPNDKPAFKKYFMHGLSHHIGLDTHDVGDFHITLEPGMVFTVEPGIYIPEENIGIRLENDVVVTNDEPDDLMADIPIQPDEIEALMNS